MLITSQEGHRGVLVGGKGGIRGMEIVDVNEMRDTLVQESGRRKYTDQCLKSPNRNRVIEGIGS